MDNEEAKIVVGRNIPFPVSTGRDNNGQPIVSYQREDVAITLKVTPQINESNFVTLEVFQEVQEVEEDNQGLDASSAGFITSKRPRRLWCGTTDGGDRWSHRKHRDRGGARCPSR